MFRSITALTLAGALVAMPAFAAKPILPTGGTSHGSSAPADNMADQLNGQSLTATQSGGAYTPVAAGSEDAKPMSGETGMKGHHMMHHRMRHMRGGASRSDETATPGMSNNPAAVGNPVAK